jgi:hypothetical protein
MELVCVTGEKTYKNSKIVYSNGNMNLKKGAEKFRKNPK